MTTKTENKKNGKVLCEYKKEINDCYKIKDEIYDKMSFAEIKKIRFTTKLITKLIDKLEKFLAEVAERKV